MIALLRSIAELIKEFEDFTSILLIDIKSDERRLDERNDLFQQLAILLDHVLIDSVGRTHELGVLFLVLAQLGEILLVQVVEEIFNSFFGLE